MSQDIMTQYYSMDMPSNILEMGVTMPVKSSTQLVSKADKAPTSSQGVA